MATIKSYTDIEQSKKLAEILPLDSADMTYYACVKDWRGNSVEPKWGKPANLTKEELALPRANFQEYEYVPAWSLATLFGVLPMIKEGEDTANPFIAKTPDNEYYVVYATSTKEVDNSLIFDNPVDACYDMIIKLHELKML